MKNKTYIIKIGWHPDKLDPEDIEDMFADKFGVYAEVQEA